MTLSRAPRDGFLDFFAESGNSALLGVRAVTTFRAELLTFSLTFHSRFLARKNSVVVVTRGRRQHSCCQQLSYPELGRRHAIPPIKHTTTTMTTMMTKPPVEMLMAPELVPEAPASTPDSAPGAGPPLASPRYGM